MDFLCVASEKCKSSEKKNLAIYEHLICINTQNLHKSEKCLLFHKYKIERIINFFKYTN